MKRDILITSNKIYRKMRNAVRSVGIRNRPMPNTVYWMYGNVCNLKCQHCDVWRVQTKEDFKNVMTLEKKYELLSKVSDWIGKPFSLNFFAGEIFLHKDIFDVLTYASKTNAITSITSNATLLATPKQAQKLINTKLNYISISLDSMSASFHDRNRGMKGVRNKVLKTVKLLQDEKKKQSNRKTQIWLNSIILKDNLGELIELVKYCKKEKIDGIAFQPIASTAFFGGLKNYDPLWYETSPVWPDTDEVIKFIDELRRLKKEGYPVKNSENDFRRFEAYFKDPELFAQLESTDHEIETMVISREGKFRLTLIEDINGNLGSIFKDDITDKWNSKEADFQRNFICNSTSQSKIIPCKKEDFYFI